MFGGTVGLQTLFILYFISAMYILFFNSYPLLAMIYTLQTELSVYCTDRWQGNSPCWVDSAVLEFL